MGAHKCWSNVWKVRTPHRVRFFVWLALQDRLMTNANRFIRGLTDDPRCFFCGETEENVDHILRRCPVATSVWRKFPGMNDDELFGKNCNDWIASNIQPVDDTRDPNWPMVFTHTIWWLWKWRNNRCFDRVAEIPVDQLGFIMTRVGLIKRAFDREEGINRPGKRKREEVYIR